MSTRFKDFGSGDSKQKEPLAFKLHEEEFTCLPQLQGKVLLDLIAKSGSDDPAASSEIMNKFFSNALTDESYERFEALLNSKDKIVHVDTLSEIVTWLIGEYGGRPNLQPEDSSPGQ